MLTRNQTAKRLALLTGMLAGLSLGSSVSAAPLDQVQLGDASSEQQHNLSTDHSQIVRGGLDQSARQLLPLDPVSFEGGSVSFDLKVEPRRQNYITVKLWGSDRGVESGRLVLFANGLQVGYRHEGDYDVLNQCDEEGECPGRFLYQTLPLPESLTHGKSNVQLKILCIGPQWPYGTNFTQYQKDLTQATRGIYRVYSHTETQFVPPVDEPQGDPIKPVVRTEPGEEIIQQSRTVVIQRLGHLLAQNPRATYDQKARAAQLLLLGDAWNTKWTPTYHNAKTLDLIILDGDSMARDFATNKNYAAKDWPGAGPLGEAVLKTWPAIGTKIDNTCRNAWSHALLQSVTYWRTHRRDYTNQSMIVDRNIYTANRALQLIDPTNALPESQTMYYLYQAVGLKPWVGSDIPDQGGAPFVSDASSAGVNRPFGEHYFLVTRKGLTRELGWVGTYGETILHFTHDIALLTGDEKIRQQLEKLEASRMYFRYPGLDGDGFRCMKLASEIDNRTAHYPLAGSAYTAPGIREEWWMDIPALLSDSPIAVGAAQQAMEDNQYFSYVKSRLADPDTQGMMRNVDEYEQVKSLPASSYRMPMGDGQPDFVFSDEQDAVVAIKHGDDRLFINLYYRAEHGVNGVARLLEVTPNLTRIATLQTEFQVHFTDGTYTRQDWIDATRSKGFPPPGEDIQQAWAGEKMPIAARPSDAKLPKYGDWGPFLGKADFYRLRYGPYLIAVNTSETESYSLKIDPDLVRSVNLLTGKPIEGSEPISVGPLSTVVLRIDR